MATNYENETTLRVGQITPIYATLSSALGLITLVDATFTLFGPDGNVVAPYSAVPTTGVEGDGTAELTVWYTLDTTALTCDILGSTYIARLDVTASDDSDLVTRTTPVEVLFVLLPSVEKIAATYDLTTPVGQTRFWLKDLHNRPPIWSDEEIEGYLIMSGGPPTIAGGIPILAAALAFDLAAGDAAKFASVKRIAIFQIDNTNLPIALREHATWLRGLYLSGFGSIPIDQLPDEFGIIPGVGGTTPSRELFPRALKSDTPDTLRGRW